MISSLTPPTRLNPSICGISTTAPNCAGLRTAVAGDAPENAPPRRHPERAFTEAWRARGIGPREWSLQRARRVRAGPELIPGQGTRTGSIPLLATDPGQRKSPLRGFWGGVRVRGQIPSFFAASLIATSTGVALLAYIMVVLSEECPISFCSWGRLIPASTA